MNLDDREWTEDDLRQVESLDLSQERVVARLAGLVGIDLRWRGPDRERWYATPRDGAMFAGTLAQIAAYVLGYAVAYRAARADQRSVANDIAAMLRERMERSAPGRL